jgi:glutamate racemase
LLHESSGSIGIFDSGVGGLSVLRAVRQVLPQEPMIYLADQAHVPYGLRELEEVRIFSEGISRFLIEQGCKLIIVACNAASAAALFHLREVFPNTPFVGMEPAVKPAAEKTQSGVVGVLATSATFQGALYASVVERFANGVALLQDTCPGLVSQIEVGFLDTPETRLILEKALLPMLAKNIDTIVLGCTHYPFVIPLIQEIVGDSVRVIDPAPAIARQASRLLDLGDLRQDHSVPAAKSQETADEIQILTSGDPAALSSLLPKLIKQNWPVTQVCWSGPNVQLC